MSKVLAIAPGLTDQSGPIAQAGVVFRGSLKPEDRRPLCPREPDHQAHQEPFRILYALGKIKLKVPQFPSAPP
jgi:hypothetical protein